MTKTIAEGFRTFHGRLTPTQGEIDAAMSHRSSIESCLKSNYSITRFFRTGSFGNGTSIRGYSDVDYFASIPQQYQKTNSSYILRDVRDVLDSRFPYTDVCVRTPGILLPFGTDGSESNEVIPAYFVKKDNNFQIYKIADGNSGWIGTSPEAHNHYVKKYDNKLGNKLKPLIRFIKAWKYIRDVPVSSFYLELSVAKYASNEKNIQYSFDVRKVLKILWDSQLAAIQDPMGISGYINPCTTQAKKIDALSKLNTALIRAQKARDAENSEKISDVFYWWNQLYDGRFPSYY
ncbi:MAG: nucleotidyltransferase [Candidatus Peribacteraceae bacterium]|nr:nucleotidyltransferase [Candidatus Peribacteraceae bacterium]